jgi:NADPH:quinone reductase-like Zn-dependent oxidoreductase/short-subunit dehydrogenase/acyl carrier protein
VGGVFGDGRVDGGVAGVFGGWRVGVGERGTLDGLRVVDGGVGVELGVGQVCVGVRAAGLNFRDVLIALGLYPGDASVGGEGAGVVLGVGPGVDGFAPGDRVLGLLDGAFGSVAVTDARFLVGVPEGWSFVRAASVPIAFLTAYYGLVGLGGLRAGERVLVHAASGGVGMAAVQIARWLGAEVFGTASVGKWDALRALGLDDAHIASSRTLEFAQRFSGESVGGGMDVVLDSLAGEFVDASLGLLGSGGRFLEMGKTDVRDPGEVGESHPGVLYRAFDLGEPEPRVIAEMLGELLVLFEKGVLEGLPVREWNVRRAPEAFRFMSQARHVGKNVLRVQAPFDRNGTVLITGATGLLGGLLARHLVAEHGVRHLLLASRSGPDAEGARELRGELEGLGASVRLEACDVGDRAQLEGLLAQVDLEHPLDGVVHAAGVLDDGVIDSLTVERLEGVFAPKALGAWHLHELTIGMDLSAFVLFSSATGTFGAPGQANYAAANAFLDALASHRRGLGLAATSMAWGLWQSTGEQGMSTGDVQRMTRSGVAALSDIEGLQLFDAALALGETLTVPIKLDMPALRKAARNDALPPLLRGLIRAPTTRTSPQTTQTLARQLTNAPPQERERIALDAIRTHIAHVLGHTTPQAINPNHTFKEHGFDSLTAVELRNRLNTATGLRLPATLVFDHPTPRELVRRLLEEIFPDSAGAHGEVNAEEASVRRLLASIPLARLRETGLLDTLLSLGQDTGHPLAVPATELIDTLDVDDLVRMTIEQSGSLTETNGGS